ncbi:MAG: hypothetical protein RIF32_12760 [Leptospirales bacterium]
MQEPVRIYFDETGLSKLLEKTSLHAIVRAAIDQQVLRIVAAPETAAAPAAKDLATMGIRVQVTGDAGMPDYSVLTPDTGEGPPGGPSTPISFDTFCQYVEKMM